MLPQEVIKNITKNNMQTVKIVVTGANGQLGSEIRLLVDDFCKVGLLSNKKYEFVFADRNDFSLENFVEIENFLNQHQPQFVINCAAYTAVDKAETERASANNVNHLAVECISKWCAKNDCKLIHISTDYVFDGESAIPIKEDAVANPINYYGETKYLGEVACQQNCPDAIIIRTAWVYSEFGANFVKTMIRLMTERDSIGVIDDQKGSPTYAADLAKTILEIIANPNWQAGVYHYSNEGEISWYEFAKAIQEIKKLDCVVNPIPTTAYPTPAKRPKYSLLDKTKIKANYQIEIPNYKSSLLVCLSKI